MSAVASRVVLRQSRFAVRRAGVRNASSTTEVAKEKAGEATSKASEGLSKVTSSAGAAANKVSSATANAAGQAQAATGQAQAQAGGMVGRVQGLVPTATYYSRVALELGKLISHQRAMSPPSVATVQKTFQPVLNAARNPMSLLNQINQTASSSAAQPANMINTVRSMSTAQWASIGVVVAETIGFFTVGEMIGRFKLVGYRGKKAEH